MEEKIMTLKKSTITIIAQIIMLFSLFFVSIIIDKANFCKALDKRGAMRYTVTENRIEIRGAVK